MAKTTNGIHQADKRILVLKPILRDARFLAESNPKDDRNVRHGLTEVGMPMAAAAVQVSTMFNELELLLEHLHVMHLAASFELEAKRRLNTVIGDARSAIRKGRKDRSPWPQRLVRTAQEFDGLSDIAEMVDLDEIDQDTFKKARFARNAFSHGTDLSNVPQIAPDAALEVFIAALDELK